MIIFRVEMGAVQKAISLYGVGTNRHDLLISKNYFFRLLSSNHFDSQQKKKFYKLPQSEFQNMFCGFAHC